MDDSDNGDDNDNNNLNILKGDFFYVCTHVAGPCARVPVKRLRR